MSRKLLVVGQIAALTAGTWILLGAITLAFFISSMAEFEGVPLSPVTVLVGLLLGLLFAGCWLWGGLTMGRRARGASPAGSRSDLLSIVVSGVASVVALVALPTGVERFFLAGEPVAIAAVAGLLLLVLLGSVAYFAHQPSTEAP